MSSLLRLIRLGKTYRTLIEETFEGRKLVGNKFAEETFSSIAGALVPPILLCMDVAVNFCKVKIMKLFLPHNFPLYITILLH